MSRFTWWRRERPKKKLTVAQAKKNKLKSVAQQQLEYGNFDHSSYYNQAQKELQLRDQALAEFCANYKGYNPEQDPRHRDIWKKYQVRYLKLMEDYHNDELRTLGELRKALIDEFEIDGNLNASASPTSPFILEQNQESERDQMQHNQQVVEGTEDRT